MNVRPGDIARIAVDVDGNRDRFVGVLRYGMRSDHGDVAWWCEALQRLNGTFVVSNMPVAVMPGQEVLIADRFLRVVDGGTAPDETLAWARVPKPSFESLADQAKQPQRTESWTESRPWMKPAKQMGSRSRASDPTGDELDGQATVGRVGDGNRLEGRK